jgi:hypothetical protein
VAEIPYEIAQRRAKEKNILLVKVTEITRDTPPGHFNAIFLEDINSLDTAVQVLSKSYLDIFGLVRREGAYARKCFYSVGTLLTNLDCIFSFLEDLGPV